MPMHCCEFCNTLFKARPQVKHPRACKNCQKKRQMANEKAWRERNKKLYDNKYHQIKKIHRNHYINDITKKITECIQVGRTFLNIDFNPKTLHEYLLKLFQTLGVRQINKFWNA